MRGRGHPNFKIKLVFRVRVKDFAAKGDAIRGYLGIMPIGDVAILTGNAATVTMASRHLAIVFQRSALAAGALF